MEETHHPHHINAEQSESQECLFGINKKQLTLSQTPQIIVLLVQFKNPFLFLVVTDVWREIIIFVRTDGHFTCATDKIRYFQQPY